MPTLRRSDAVTATITVPTAPVWSAIPDQSGTVGNPFTTLSLRQYLDDGGLEATVEAELKMAIHRVSDDDISLSLASPSTSDRWLGGLATSTRLYFVEADTTDIAYAFDLSGNAQAADNISLGTGGWQGGTATSDRLYFVDWNGTVRHYNHSGGDSQSFTLPTNTGWRGALTTSNRIYFINNISSEAVAYNHNRVRQTADDIDLSGISGSILGGLATQDRIYIIFAGTPDYLRAWDYSGTRQSGDDVQFTGAPQGGTFVGSNVAMESDRIYIVDAGSGGVGEAQAYTIHDDLPAGLSISDNPTTEVTEVSGTPTQEQTFTACFKAENSVGEDTVEVDFAIAA